MCEWFFSPSRKIEDYECDILRSHKVALGEGILRSAAMLIAKNLSCHRAFKSIAKKSKVL
jgi:hypothetical protein